MAAPKVQLGWDNSQLQDGAAKAQGIVAGFASSTKATLGKALTSDVGGAFGSFSAALGSLAGLKSVIDGFDRLNDLSVQLDTNVESLQRLGGMAKLSGSDVETLVKGVSKLTRSLADAENSDKTAEALRHLGISASQLRSLSIEDQIFALSDAFVNARNRGEGFAEVFDLMGRNGAELIPLLAQGREELEALSQVPVLSEEQIQRLADFNDRLDTGILKIKAWTANTLLGASEAAAVFAAAFAGGRDQGTFIERLDQAAEALAQSKVEAEETAKAKEKQRKEAREAADWAKKIAAAQKEAAASIEKGQKELEAQEKRMQSIREQIDQAKDANLKQQNTPEENLELARSKVAEIDKQISGEQGLSAGADQERLLQLELERQKAIGEVLAMEEQISAQKERQQQAEAEKQARQNESRLGLANELQVLQLRAQGRDKQADALERQIRIQQEAKRITEETGLSEQEALRAAQARADLEDKVAKRGKSGTESIHGFSRVAAGLPAFTGLAEFEALQQGTRGNRAYDAFFRGTDNRFTIPQPQRKTAYERAGDLLRTRAANNQPREGSSNKLNLTEGNQIVQLLTEIREGISDFAAV